MITRITLENFKSFAEPSYADTRDLLVIAGPNSCGKTTIIQAILLLAQTLESQRPDIALDLGGKYVQFAEFKNIVFGRPEASRARFSIEIDLALKENDIPSAVRKGIELPVGLRFSRRDQILDAQVDRNIKFKITFGATVSGTPVVKAARFTKLIGERVIVSHLVEQLRKNYRATIELPQQLTASWVTAESLLEKIAALQSLSGNAQTTSNVRFKGNLARLLREFFRQYSVDWDNPPEILNAFKREIESLRLRDYPEWTTDIRNCFAEIADDMLAYLYQAGYSSTIALPPLFDHFFPMSLYSSRIVIPDDNQIASYARIFDNTFSEAIREIRRYLRTIQYLGPLRAKPERAYLATGTPLDIGNAGENAVPILWAEQDKKIPTKVKIGESSVEKRLAVAVQEWFEEFGIASSLHVTKPKRVIYQAELESRPGSNTIVTIADVGFGVSQLLPVIVAGLRAPIGATLIFEQPEIHLHPRLQAKLADFFICLVELGKKVIVETHSEHLINMLRLRIVQDETEQLKNKVNILFVRSAEKPIGKRGGSSGGSHIENLKMDEYGHIMNWPPDFFAESSDLNEQILKAMMDRHSRGSI